MEMATTRSTAAARRDELLDAAMVEFAEHGFEGASTEDIARRAGISQPYLFRLFGTKKELFKASVARCLREALELFQRAAEGKRGKEALEAIGQAYREQLEQDRTRLRAQMNAYVACDDPEIRDVVRAGFGDLVAYVRRVSGADWPTVWSFFATGMLFNVLASMHVDDEPEPWMTDLLSGCGKEPL
jgi:AcrR family transcriptional regulator